MSQTLTYEAAERRAKILELRKAGVSVPAIARNLEIPTHKVAKEIREALAELGECAIKNADAIRTLELERLDEMLRAVWPAVRGGDVQSIGTALKISERRAKLTGLDAPSRTEVTGANGSSISITSDLDVTKLSDAELYQLGSLLEKTLPRLDAPGGTPEGNQEGRAAPELDEEARNVGEGSPRGTHLEQAAGDILLGEGEPTNGGSLDSRLG